MLEYQPILCRLPVEPEASGTVCDEGIYKVESMLCNITVAPSMGCASASVTFPLIVCAVAVPAKEIRNNNVPIIICFSYSLVFNIFFNFDETKVGRLFSLRG